ncbi:MAG TPA: helix-turn-helix domain-containing protein [Alloacidobacterium sp.]|nr:helix-turn-helix domain-containing protein [Alloacidobacterium sp.]
MPQSLQKTKNKHQARTEETQAKILDAAEAIFSEQGFEKTQLEEVASRAGYTRGAIYAHYSSKEDLFLALMEHRVLTKFTAIRHVIEAEPDVSKRPGIFKHWLVAQLNDHAWGTLMLEFKLYALRRPQSREKLRHMYDLLLIRSSGEDFIGVLFGNGMDKTTRAAIERRLAVMGAIVSAVILESHFRPKLLPKQHLQAVLDELYGALIHA